MTVWRAVPSGGGATTVEITGTPAIGETLHCAAPDGAVFQWLREGSPIAGATGVDHVVVALDQSRAISCAVTVESNELDVAAADLTTIAFFGDSFTAGAPNGVDGGPSDLAHRYSTLTAGLLGLTEENYGVGGSMNWLNADLILTKVYQHTELPTGAPYGPLPRIAVIQASINNLNYNPIVADATIVADAVVRAVHRLRAAGSYDVSDTDRWAFTGSWVDVPGTDANFGSQVKRAFTNGDTWTLNVPADFPGGVLHVTGPKTTGYGAVETITVDGSPHGTIDNRTASVQTGSQPWDYPIELTAGAHTITGTVSSLSTVENINGADFEIPTDVPTVVVLNTARAPGYPGGEHTITDANVNAQNAALASALDAAFPDDLNVILIDIDTLLAKNPTNFGTDLIHPGNAGTALMASAIAAAL